jgi:hypothetical protein
MPYFYFREKWGIIYSRRGIMLEAEWEFYESNRNELVEKYCGKYIVISGDKVVSAYDDENEAYFETVKTIPRGSFMIHHVMEEEEVYQLSPFIGV